MATTRIGGKAGKKKAAKKKGARRGGRKADEHRDEAAPLVVAPAAGRGGMDGGPAIGDVEWARIVAASEQAEDAEQRAEALTADWTAAKEEIQSRQETLSGIRQEVHALDDKDHPPEELMKRFLAADDDLARAEEAYALVDRKRRKFLDLAKKMVARIREIVTQVRGGELDYEGKRGRRDPEAWKRVEVSDLVGEMLADPYAKVAIRTVEDVITFHTGGGLKACVQQGELSPEQRDYLLKVVSAFLDRRGVHNPLPRGRGEMVVPDAPRGAGRAAKDEEAEDDDGGESEGAAANRRMDAEDSEP